MYDEIYEGPKDVGAFFEKVYDEVKRKYKYKLVGGHGLVVAGFGDGKVDGRKVSYWRLQNSHGVGWGLMEWESLVLILKTLGTNP
jgi:hypothetical protein